MSKKDSSSELLSAVERAIDAQNVEDAITTLDEQSPAVAAAIYEKVQNDLYWSRKNVPFLVTFSQAGIRRLQQAAAADAGKADALLSSAKQLAYNLASYTWIGWDQAGIALQPSDTAAGSEAAKLNLQLAIQLAKPERALANAHWLLGAHQLANKLYNAAAESFSQGETVAVDVGDSLMPAMLRAYLLLTRSLHHPTDVSLKQQLEIAIRDLRRDHSDDAKEYARQLEVADRVFRR